MVELHAHCRVAHEIACVVEIGLEKDETYEGSRIPWTWKSRETQKTSWWSRKRWWYAPRKNHDGEIVSDL